MRAPHVSEQRDVPVVGALVLLHLSGIGDVLDAVHKQVGMGVPPEQRPKLQAAHVEVQQPDLALWVLAVRHSVHVEHLCALVDLRPEAMLELLLRVPQGLVLAKRIQLREHAHDPRKAVDLEDVQELEGFHLEAEARVDEQQDQIRDLGQVHHGAEVMCRALEERHAAPLARDHRDGASDLPDVAVGVELHERADQGALAAAGWPHHDGDEGRRLIFRAVHHGDVLLALRSVQVALRAALRPPHIRDAEGARVMALRRQSALLLLGDALLVCFCAGFCLLVTAVRGGSELHASLALLDHASTRVKRCTRCSLAKITAYFAPFWRFQRCSASLDALILIFCARAHKLAHRVKETREKIQTP
mmetsp:Transcript_11990/g.44558  ORF Transcript_11990/g.44558 Transcript_11990/m.44558 type:complete len:360 (+) Transcript_11990:3098-4177(+)